MQTQGLLLHPGFCAGGAAKDKVPCDLASLSETSPQQSFSLSLALVLPVLTRAMLGKEGREEALRSETS